MKAVDGRAASWGELHFKLLEAVAPPSVLIDAEHEILHLSPSAGRFLQYGGGEPSKNLLRAVHPSLRIELRAALYEAAQKHASAEVLVSPVELAGESMGVQIRATPVKAPAADMFVVSFEARPVGALAQGANHPPGAGADPVAAHLDRELERLKAHLRDTVEQYEASTEELKASNEELQAMNEELRSATEELETSREELQSINEELTTVNHELKGKVDELGQANSDMQNLMDATAIATVFLDRELRITRYTPSAVSLFNLIASDLGRPLADLATRLDYPQLSEDAKRVLDKLVPIEREVSLPDGKWFLSRLLPYRTIDDHIAGVVVSFIDITPQKQAAAQLRSSEERLRLVVENATEYAIFSTDLERHITIWNSGAQRLLGYAEGEVMGQLADIIFTAEDRAAHAPELETQAALTHGRASDDRWHQRKDGSRFWASGAMMLMRDAQGQAVGFVKILRDQTAEREAQQALETSQADLLRALEENEKARADLQAADSAKDRFLAVLSHELRNPLASIDSAALLLLEPGVPVKDKDAAAQVVKRQAGSMKVLLDDLLDVSRLKLGPAGTAPGASDPRPGRRCGAGIHPAAAGSRRPRFDSGTAGLPDRARRRPAAARPGAVEPADERDQVHAGPRGDRREGAAGWRQRGDLCLGQRRWHGARADRAHVRYVHAGPARRREQQGRIGDRPGAGAQHRRTAWRPGRGIVGRSGQGQRISRDTSRGARRHQGCRCGAAPGRWHRNVRRRGHRARSAG